MYGTPEGNKIIQSLLGIFTLKNVIGGKITKDIAYKGEGDPRHHKKKGEQELIDLHLKGLDNKGNPVDENLKKKKRWPW